MKNLRNIKKAKYTFILFLVLIFLILTTVVLINKPTIGVGWISSCPHCGSFEINYYSDSEMHNYMCNNCHMGEGYHHVGGSHSNNGVCTTCYYQYQMHTQSNTISKYDTTQTTHTPIYTCSVSGCTATYSGSIEQHLGGTHENGGKCTVCNLPYQTHTQSNTISKYDTTQTTHTPIYTCSVSGCTSTYTASTEQHLGGTHENGGKCTVCNLPYQTHTQSNTISKYNTTQTTHTPIYTCSFSGCTSTYTGSANQHELYNWIDNKNGTHSSSCTLCNYKVTQEHNYKDGKCITCNSLIPTTSCEHTYITKNDDTQHWQVCSKCNTLKSNSLQEHSYSNYTDNKNGTHIATCKSCNYQLIEPHPIDGTCTFCKSNGPINNDDANIKNTITDNTIAIGTLPQTGISNIILVSIFMLIIILGIIILKMKQYKDV